MKTPAKRDLFQVGAQRTVRRQSGFGLAGMMVALAIATLLAVLASAELARRVNDAAAQATAHYLLTLRDAMIAFQLKHEAWLSGVDLSAAPPGVHPPAPPLEWAAFGDVQIAHGTVALLKDQALLPRGLPDHTPLGERAQFLLVRGGTCPDAECQLHAYVYTCHPVSARPSSKTPVSCQSPSGARARYDAALLGQVMLSTEGYGAHDALVPGRFVGPLIDADKAWFPLSNNPGHAVVAGTLASTPFGQFVRMGDTRHVWLADRLTVSGAIHTSTGLVLDTHVVPGTPCATPRLHATTANDRLALCTGGQWQLHGNRTVQGVFTHLVHGAHVAPPVCQVSETAFRHVALTATDVEATGPDLQVDGEVGGTLGADGNVDTTGAVRLSGTFRGGFQSSDASRVRIRQEVTIDASHRIRISPPGPDARAAVIQGCTQ